MDLTSFVTCFLCILCSFLCKRTLAFNVESRRFVSHKGPPDSKFGFSLAFHKDSQGTWLLVGAPEAETYIPRVTKAGAVYRCDVSVDNACENIPFDTKGPHHDGTQYMDDKSHQWFGASVTSRSGVVAIVVYGDLRGECITDQFRNSLKADVEFEQTPRPNLCEVESWIRGELENPSTYKWVVYVMLADQENLLEVYSTYIEGVQTRWVEIKSFDHQRREEELVSLMDLIGDSPRFKVIFLLPNPIDFLKLFVSLNKSVNPQLTPYEDEELKETLVPLNETWDLLLDKWEAQMHRVLMAGADRNMCFYVSYRQEFIECGPTTYAKVLKGEVKELMSERKALTECGQYASPRMTFRVGALAMRFLERLDTEQSIDWLYLPERMELMFPGYVAPRDGE